MVALAWSSAAVADEGNDAAIIELRHAWATASYQTPEGERETAFATLRTRAHQLVKDFPDQAAPLIWEGIIVSSHAKYQDKLVALKSAKTARNLLLHAEKHAPENMRVEVFTALGSLYHRVPRVISFGDQNKARSYFERAIQLDPDGIDSNYFYGEFLLDQGELESAFAHLSKALVASPRSGREDEDSGRRAEIEQLQAQHKP